MGYVHVLCMSVAIREVLIVYLEKSCCFIVFNVGVKKRNLKDYMVRLIKVDDIPKCYVVHAQLLLKLIQLLKNTRGEGGNVEPWWYSCVSPLTSVGAQLQ